MKQIKQTKGIAFTVFAIGLALSTLAATPTITGVTAQQRYPWNGKFDVSYTASGVGAACEEQGKTASLKVFAVEQTTHVTNVAEAAYLSGDTTMADGTHAFVWDMDAQGVFQNLVSTNFEVFVSVEATGKSLGGVQLWEGGPYWAECNVGASQPEEYGYYFMWGDTNAYVRQNNVWVSVKDGAKLEDGFTQANGVTYNKDIATLTSEGYIDETGNLVAAHDAATAHLGGSWRMPTKDECTLLQNNCDTSWITTNGVPGRLVRGKDAFENNTIFLPAAGNGSMEKYLNVGTNGYYFTSTPYSKYDYIIMISQYNLSLSSYGSRFQGYPVRPLRSAAGSESAATETLCVGGSGNNRADLRTGAVRIAATSEKLTYSTAWDGGETATIRANDETLCENSGSGIYEWTPSVGGLYVLTHTVEANSVPVVLTANFVVPVQVGDNAMALITNGVCEIVGTGATWAKNDWSGDNPLKAYDAAITNLVVASGITGLGANSFENMWYVQNVTLGSDVTSVGDRAFKKCYGLTNVTSTATGASSVGEYAFSGCHSLQGLSFAGAASFDEQAYTLQAAIYMKDGGIPVVYAMPTITVAGKSEHIMGKKTLADEWTDVTNFTDDEKKPYHFFKIEMK